MLISFLRYPGYITRNELSRCHRVIVNKDTITNFVR